MRPFSFVLRLLPLPLLGAPLVSFAHEVYVLDPATVSLDIANVSPNPFSLAISNFPEFSLWALIGVITVGAVFLISILHKIEDWLCPALMTLKPFAPVAARVTLGTSLIFAALHGGFMGPEFSPFSQSGYFTTALITLLYVSGASVLFGLFTRLSAAFALAWYVFLFFLYGSYMLTYLDYAGLAFLALVLGSGSYSLDGYRGAAGFKKIRLRRLIQRLEPYAFPLLRLCFGAGLLYASWYAKFAHASLALDTVMRYHLTDYFHFDPLFIVLGAFIIEVLLGIFFIIGFEIRFAALFFLTFLVLSLLYFGEDLWPHLVLIGGSVALFFHGYDRLSFGGRFFKRMSREPVF
ncbi:MAG: hypothetical protein UY94_C0027G0006 [Parcubacteria group bacterium GW2011_GWA2_56_21]|nr:MAG: hypothetical protein UY94_C0027G0006 [Parcubacteria group bacterium GW2011_GWA2_56_21]